MKKLLLNILKTIMRKYPKQVLNIRFFKKYHRKINWKNPKDIQEYVFKIYIDDFNKSNLRIYGDLTDKIKVRNFIREKIGESYLTRLLGVWNSEEDINFDLLPNQFVLKTNNGCGTNIIIKNKSKELDIAQIKRKLRNWKSYPYGELSGQPHYSLIKPKILAEEYLIQDKNKDILPFDYKFFCFDGEPKFVILYEGRKLNEHKANYMAYDINWNKMNNFINNPIKIDIDKPKCWDLLLELVKKLCYGFKFVRVDFYVIDNKPYFGEMTFTPSITALTDNAKINLMNLINN